jgi:hypothetical protein
VVCEGEKTEPNYFKGFNIPDLQIKIIGLGKNTDSLVKEAVKIWKEFAEEEEYFEHLWCVFDRDDFPQENYNQAFISISEEQTRLNRKYKKKAGRDIRIKIAYSNEAFELWYLLHYNYHENGISRNRYKELLSQRMEKEYLKNDNSMYDNLQKLAVTTDGRQGQKFAVRNAKKLRNLCTENDHHNQNPCTNVDELVEELNQHLKK